MSGPCRSLPPPKGAAGGSYNISQGRLCACVDLWAHVNNAYCILGNFHQIFNDERPLDCRYFSIGSSVPCPSIIAHVMCRMFSLS